MNDKSIDGIFRHNNRKYAECFRRTYNRAGHIANGRRHSHHSKRFLKWILKTSQLADKIMTGAIQ